MQFLLQQHLLLIYFYCSLLFLLFMGNVCILFVQTTTRIDRISWLVVIFQDCQVLLVLCISVFISQNNINCIYFGKKYNIYIYTHIFLITRFGETKNMGEITNKRKISFDQLLSCHGLYSILFYQCYYFFNKKLRDRQGKGEQMKKPILSF